MRPSRGGHATEGTIIVEHDGGWAYKVNAVFSETFPTHDEALAAAQAAAKEQEVPGHTETIEYEDDKGKWHTETASGETARTPWSKEADIGCPTPSRQLSFRPVEFETLRTRAEGLPGYPLARLTELRRIRRACCGPSEVGHMFEMVELLAGTNLLLLAFSVLIFDIPRYTLSLVSLALFGMRKGSDRVPAGNASVSVIIPTFNGGSGLEPTIASLHRQTLRPVEIIVVDDGSTDETRAVAERARAQGLVNMVICHGTRCGRSAAINAAARFASGDLLLTVDADTVFEPTAVARLAAAFSDPRVAGASCNIAINNERDSLWTGLQSVEYLMSISAGRSILDVVGAIACLSGACSMYRRDIFVRQGGLDVGPGEDLEYSLRLRRLGYLIRFVPDAWAQTAGPTSGISLLRQRARWDRDAFRIRFMMYGELSFFHRFKRLPDTLQRLDFIVFDLVPTLSLPFYLAYIVLLFGDDAARFLAGIYFLLLWISIFNMALAFVMFNRSIGLFGLGAALIFPLYQGVYLKCARFFSYSSEIILATSRHDDFVPPRVRRALLGDRI